MFKKSSHLFSTSHHQDHSNKTIGQKGEDAACAYLLEKSYTILERNKRMGKGEIDIVAAKNQTIVFVEVKSATYSAFFHPSEHFTYKKSTQLKALAKMYLSQVRYHEMRARIDLITVIFDRGQTQCEQFENVCPY